MTMRYVAAFFLIVLLLLILGVIFGYLTLDTDAPLGRQLTAAGALAALWTCDDYGENCSWMNEAEDEDMYYRGADSEPVLVEEEWWYGNEPPPDMGDDVDELYYGSGGGIDDSEQSYWWLHGGEGDVVVDEWKEWEEPRFSSSGGWYDEWVEDEYWFDERQRTQNSQNPWYVNAFPGIGQMVQQIIPGQSFSVRAPQPPPRPVYPQPSCWIAAQPTSVEYDGSSTISWSSFYASRASLTDFGSVSLTGTRVVKNIRADRTYQLSVTGAGGNGSCYTRIAVHSQSAVPSCAISAYPSTIRVGESSSLAWGSDNASSAYLSQVGSVAPQGGAYVAPSKTTSYTLTVFSALGASNTCTTQIGVLP